MKTEVHSLTAEDIKKASENLQRVPKRSEEAQEVYDTLFNYFSQMILNSDFVKVVRCKDCKKFRNAICRKFIVCTKPTDYCSYGERRETE